ncbi:Cof-type HAD-IIB family hydrolase [Paenibacillus koleovorans]|uniref:Cof-type HAD-IIB family hydrolase n=1 Tax=Paenibacillus koleovorans TaxID=121608 RepID=UPI000FD9FF58|nr:Cof-type HAD-IIB family hydrolase [Paenibacillus koleovorans]
MIKLAVFDVDGTLRDREYMPDSTRAALQRLRERGIALALCTGRSEHEMASLREELGIDWAVTCNGSHVGYRGKTVLGSAFAAETVKQWLTEAEAKDHGLVLYGSERMLTNRPDSPWFRQAQREIGFMEPDPIASPEHPVPDIYQCIVFCDEQEETGYLSVPLASPDTVQAYYTHRWRPWAIDINPAGMNKAVGLRRLLDHLGLRAEEVAAFGDGLNDLEMISSVGSGIAMGNAIEELKARAAFVTKTMHEDGIAYAVDQFVLPQLEKRDVRA